MRGELDDSVLDALLMITAANPYTTWVALLNGKPALLYGVAVPPTLPHLGQAWGIGTDKARRVAVAVGRHLKGKIIPSLREQGLKRVEVRVSGQNPRSLDWLMTMAGAEYETKLPGWSRDGTIFHQLSWT